MEVDMEMGSKADLRARLRASNAAATSSLAEIEQLQKQIALITKQRNDYRLVIQEMQGYGGGDDPDLWAAVVGQRNDLQAIVAADDEYHRLLAIPGEDRMEQSVAWLKCLELRKAAEAVGEEG